MADKKLSDPEVRYVRSIGERRKELKRQLSVMTNVFLAQKFDVSDSTISAILTYENYKGVKD